MEKNNRGFDEKFIQSLLLTLEHTNFDEFMKLSYAVIMSSPSSVVKRNDPVDEKLKSIDGMIAYFEEKEEYEKCSNLQKLKSLLHLDDTDDLHNPLF